MSEKPRRSQLSAPVDDDLRVALERAAAAEDRTLSSLVRHIMRQALHPASSRSAAA